MNSKFITSCHAFKGSILTCSIQLSSQSTLSLIDHNSSVSFSTCCTIGHVVVLSGFCHKSYLVRSITTALFHFQCRLHLEDRSHYCLVGVDTNRTWSNRSRQFSIIFDINQTYTIGQVIMMSSFHDRPHLVRSITITQFRF